MTEQSNERIVAGPNQRRCWTFSLGSMLFVVAQVAFCLAIGLQSAVAGIIAMAVFVPASLRTCWMVEQRRSMTVQMDFDERMNAFAGSVVLMALIVVASAIAFVVTCTPIAFVLVNDPFDSLDGFVVSVAVGLAAALGVLGWLLLKHWRWTPDGGAYAADKDAGS